MEIRSKRYRSLVLSPQAQPHRRRRIGEYGLLAGLAILATLASPLSSPASEIKGAPRLQNGDFENPTGPLSHGSFGTRSSFILKRIASSFSDRESPPQKIANDGSFLRANAGSSRATVTWVGHATLLVQMDGVSFLTDPAWTNTPSPIPGLGPQRFVKPGLAVDHLPPIDFVLISHNHYDHLDLGSLEALAQRSPETRFFVALENAELLRSRGIDRVEEFDWGDSVSVGSVTIYCLPAQHWSQRGLLDRNRSLWASWAVIGPWRRFYFAGDTGYFAGFEAIGRGLGPFDLAAVPIGAYEPSAMMKAAHMNPEEAVSAARDLRARKAIAMHFGTFDLSNEPLDEPPRRFESAGAAAGQEVWVFDVGETRDF